MARFDPVVTASFAVTLTAPWIVYVAIRLVREGRHDAHRLVQSVHLVMCWLAVLALELRIRLGGGSGMFVDRARPDLQSLARAILVGHISVAVVTYLAWTWLAIISRRRYRERLPGSFSRRHRRFGTLVFGGLCFTAASASAMYVLVFVA